MIKYYRLFTYFFSDLVITIFSLFHSIFSKCIIFNNSNIQSGQIFIFANGPSLKNVLNSQLLKFSSKSILVVNDFAQSSFYKHLKPKYYIFADPGYWLPNNFVSEKMISERTLTFNTIVNATNWNIDLFIPYTSHNSAIIRYLHSNSFIHVKYYNTFVFKLKLQAFINFNLKYNITATTHNVLAAAIFISINIGFKNIILLGADHSWFQDMRVDDFSRLCLIERHVYDNNNHQYNLIPWMKITNSGKTVFKLSEILDAFSKTFYQYDKLESYAKKYNVNILNCTPNSFIDSFKKGLL